MNEGMIWWMDGRIWKNEKLYELRSEKMKVERMDL